MDLLLSAFPPELGPWLDAPPDGWVTACTGVGPLAAAVSTTRLITLHHPQRLLFLGTCGAYSRALAIGARVAVDRVIDTTWAELQGDAYRPSLQVSQWATSFTPPFPACTVVALPAITCSLEGARQLGTRGDVEHLELGGVMAACSAMQVAVGAALTVANHVGPNAQREWLAHHDQASAALRDALAPWFNRLL